jgi:pyruvate formate lyase activating enzyme
MDDTRHRAVTGASNVLILDNLRLLAENGHNIILRIPVIPGINDDEDNILRIAALARELPGIQRVDLLPYHKIGSDKYARIDKTNPMPETEPPSDVKMDEISRVFQGIGLLVKTGG